MTTCSICECELYDALSMPLCPQCGCEYDPDDGRRVHVSGCLAAIDDLNVKLEAGK